jgi:hypothetical protein
MTEIGDVTDLLWGFESSNKVWLRTRLETVLVRGKVELELTIACYSDSPELPAAKLLALASVTCSATNLVNLRDALTRCLYIVDGKLAQNEMYTRGT